MFDVIPYWMWVVSLIALAVVCGAVLSSGESRPRRSHHSPRKLR
jgi:hypothetical protein